VSGRSRLDERVAVEIFKADVLRRATTIGVTPKEIHVRDMKRKWASCSSRGRLIALGLDVVEVARQIGDRPETIMRVYAHALNDAKRRDEIRQRIAQGTSIAL
jgi:hypothetical protein